MVIETTVSLAVGDDDVTLEVEGEWFSGERGDWEYPGDPAGVDLTHVRESGGSWETWEAWRRRRCPATGEVLRVLGHLSDKCAQWAREENDNAM